MVIYKYVETVVTINYCLDIHTHGMSNKRLDMVLVHYDFFIC